jgi:UDP-N-acetylmuramoyl-L-alanyl-D-glutamate--2,6-diaminopimelate ligase
MGNEGLDLRDLAPLVGSRTVPAPGVVVGDVTHDSREAGPGVLFVALRGSSHDGHGFVEEAARSGSPAVCVEDPEAAGSLPCLVVPDTRAALPVLADVVHGHPSGRLRLIGVTGTNGKTTVAHVVGAIGRAAGLPTAVAGTIGARILDEPVAMTHTTPEASDFQRLLARMVTAGVDLAAVEVSSHALALGRSDHSEFTVGAFTNLSQDHLDLHGDMETYYRAKRRLFDQCAAGVVWTDGPWGRRLASEIDIPCTTVGFDGGDVVAEAVSLRFDGSTLIARDGDGAVTLEPVLAGRFNAANVLVAAAIARVIGIDWDTIAAGVSSISAVPGRFELIETGRDFTVVVDYAHTPAGIEACIASARDIMGRVGRVIVVVGAGGDRDRAKRPLMGAAASRADLAVLTSDNPRSEDPASILGDVAAGAGAGGAVVVEPDRRLAIRAALEAARPGDAVLVLGKGHETGQEAGGVTVAFDDRDVVREEAAS